MGRKRRKNYKKGWTGLPYIALEELNFFWDQNEISEFDKLWAEGASLYELMERFNRNHAEVAVLIMDRSLKGKIKERKYGLFGGSYESRKLRKPWENI
ncbi:helix-turn-helix domain-containing protein [Cytobacillus depressus]|uniref:Helix-turn-helix domain-containing protein n=1 Tax=Cytobacillus depressus TaxID=1602942 RepID=A0A6L3UY37_9BACI|nr:helix-turn-helix domain-containing protein [Cytobacillus depressus]KAB2328954.1 helix-turn-helix domain-containing protein [Cytobacillus depressus]